MKFKRKNQSQPGTMSSKDGKSSSDLAVICDLFAKMFKSKFRLPSNVNIDLPALSRVSADIQISDIYLSAKTMEDIIRNSWARWHSVCGL